MTVLLVLLMEDVMKVLHRCKHGKVGTLLLQRRYSDVLQLLRLPLPVSVVAVMFTFDCCIVFSYVIMAFINVSSF
jgi:hypothetical protein